MGYSLFSKLNSACRTRIQKLFTTATPWINPSPILKWHLDYPSRKNGIKSTHSGLTVQGWVLLQESCEQPVYIIARWSPSFDTCHQVNTKRQDVVRAMQERIPSASKQSHCGFSFTVPYSAGKIELFLRVNDNEWPLQVIEASHPHHVSHALKVLKGKQGWLFLDNDTNNSVDQFTGKVRLTPLSLNKWNLYFQEMETLAKKHSQHYAMLIAPSKESVVGAKYHPQKEGLSPVTQVVQLAPPSLLVYPLAELKKQGDTSYFKSDTHWSHKGALTATIELATRLGIEKSTLEQLFCNDVYQDLVKGGDLGNKLTPKVTCRTEVLKSFNYRKSVIYDNGLPNIGRIIIFANKSAPIKEICLTFGSSSSYSMFSYLSRIFESYIFIHTAGNIDPELVEKVKPDYLVTQTNARFVVQAPTVEYSVSQAIREKITSLSKEEKSKTIKNRLNNNKETLRRLQLDHLEECFLSEFNNKLEFE